MRGAPGDGGPDQPAPRPAEPRRWRRRLSLDQTSPSRAFRRPRPSTRQPQALPGLKGVCQVLIWCEETQPARTEKNTSASGLFVLSSTVNSGVLFQHMDNAFRYLRGVRSFYLLMYLWGLLLLGGLLAFALFVLLCEWEFKEIKSFSDVWWLPIAVCALAWSAFFKADGKLELKMHEYDYHDCAKFVDSKFPKRAGRIHWGTRLYGLIIVALTIGYARYFSENPPEDVSLPIACGVVLLAMGRVWEQFLELGVNIRLDIIEEYERSSPLSQQIGEDGAGNS